MLERTCSGCDVCCTVAGVPELGKPAGTPCQYQGGGCALYGQPNRPLLCDRFKCSWLYGHGDESDRPDNIGAMFAINKTDTGHFHFAVETQPNALRTTARSMAVECARKFPFPVIAVQYGAQAPDDRGDWIIVRDEIKARCHRNVGDLVEMLAEDVGMYVLRLG
jgi:hypothetical protein